MPPTPKVRGTPRRTKPDRKVRLTVSLQEDTVRFLQWRQAQVSAASMSACVENVVAACRRMTEAEQLHLQTVSYYDGVSDDARAEERAWGQLAEQEFQRPQRARKS